jgi:hypothetical protein
MISCLTCVCLINEFFESNQGLDGVSPTSNLLKLADNNVILDSSQKPLKKILFETPDPLQQSVSQFKDTGLFLSPATKKIRRGHKVDRSGIQFTDIEGSAEKHYSAHRSHSKSQFSL